MTASSRTRGRDLSSWVGSEFGVGLQTMSSPVGLEITDLVGLALRRNPRRAHLLVSTVLGKHLAVDPNLVAASGRLLGELVRGVLDPLRVDEPVDWSVFARAAVRAGDVRPLESALDHAVPHAPSPVLVLGFAETATALGHLVADQLRVRTYLHSTRRVVPGVPLTASFEEGHSHATHHLLLPVPADLLEHDGAMVLVDDELSTGRTAMGAIMELQRLHPRERYVLASLVDLRTESDEAEMYSLAGRLDCRIDVVSLVRGRSACPKGFSTRSGGGLRGRARAATARIWR